MTLALNLQNPHDDPVFHQGIDVGDLCGGMERNQGCQKAPALGAGECGFESRQVRQP
jgi:hypothetical protein